MEGPSKTCTWIGPEQDPLIHWPIKMCGCPSVIGASYCGEHYWRVYARGTSVNGRRRERAIEQEIQQLKLAQELEEYENEN
jgi:hypothetical protein